MGKPLNKRVSNARIRKQQHLLEVTVRRDKAVSMRNRAIAAFISKTILFVVLGVGVWLGGKELLRRFLWENKDYFLTDVRWKTDGALTRDQIMQAAQITEGRNIFDFDLGKSRAKLDELPQVERAEIQRVLPNRIDITITERRPIAWVISSAEIDPTTSDKAMLIDARGVVMRTRTVLPEYYHLPVITGASVENFAPGQRVNTLEIHSALELVRLNADNTRWQARRIDISKGYCLVVTDRNHAKITFGLDRIEQQLERLFRYLDLVEPSQKEIQTVNLMVERNTPITFVEPLEGTDAEEQAPPATPPPAPARKVAPVTKPAEPTVRAAIPVQRATAVTPPQKARPGKSSSSRKPAAPSVRKPFRLNNG